MIRVPLLRVIITALAGMVVVSSARAQARISDTGTLEFRAVRSAGARPLLGLRLEVLDAPVWLKVLPESPLGPITLLPGGDFKFRVDYEIGSEIAQLGPGAAFSIRLRHESPDVRPLSKTWRIETQDGLVSYRATCTTSDGVSCGTAMAPDRTPPVARAVYEGPYFVSFASAILPSGVVFVSTRTFLRLEAEDSSSSSAETSGVAFIGTKLDSFVFDHLQLDVSSTTFLFLQDPYYLVFAAVDNAGNRQALQEIDLRADGTPPETSLQVGEPRAAMPDGMLLVSARTPLTFLPMEVSSSVVASGVRDTQFSMNGSAFSVVPRAFTLPAPDGRKELRWFSRDNVLNEEAVKSTTVVLDATPPALLLSCPDPSAPGFCRVFKGVIPIRGSVSDLHLSSWRLDWAPGRAATSGFAPLASGTGPASGVLASWDTAALSGFVTLRLTAADAVANNSSRFVEAFVGDPARVYALGGRKTFDKPSGVALDASSRVYVADAGRDRVFVYDAQGVFVRAYGTDGRAEPALKQPAGVALDAAGNLFVADTGNHRVVKISPAGGLLAAWGRSDTKRGLRRYKSGKAFGEFRRPGAVAVDAGGRVVVADTGNRRLQVIGPGGAVERVIDMPFIPDDDRDDDGEEEDDAEADAARSRGVPAGVAVDGAGRIYAADRKGARVVVFDASGAVLRTLQDGFERPAGVAVSLDGRCLAVSDRELDFIRRYDEDGLRLLAFGVEGEAKDAAGLPAVLVLKKPLGLTLGPDGALYVADSGNGLIQGFAPPTGPPVVSVGLRAKHGGGFRTSATALAAPVEPPPSAVADVGAGGGTLRRADRAGVEVPKGALNEVLTLGVHEPEGPDDSRAKRAKALRLAPAGPAVEYGPHGLVFDRPVTLLLPYDRALAARNGWRASDLRAQHWDEARGDWEPLPGRLDESEGVIRAETTHFSVYQVQGPDTGGMLPAAVPAAAEADASFAFRDLYAFPNPAKDGRRPVIRLQAGVADAVEVSIYDVSGERVHSGAFGPPTVLDDGNGKGPQWTYDYVWDAGTAGSGVYIYVVTAKKGGQADIRKSGRLAVLK